MPIFHHPSLRIDYQSENGNRNALLRILQFKKRNIFYNCREKVNRTIQLSQIHFDEEDILDSQSTSSRSNSPILNPPPSYSELVTEVHVDQVTDVNEQTEEGI